jgi:uncharacterized protein (DUF2384 family)
MLSTATPHATASNAAVIAKAVIRAADRLDVSSKSLARILGVSEATVSRLKKGDYALDKKPFELAVVFIRLYRSLDAIVGGDDSVAKAWLKNQNTALMGRPVELIESVSGLTNVIQYLDARRAVI